MSDFKNCWANSQPPMELNHKIYSNLIQMKDNRAEAY